MAYSVVLSPKAQNRRPKTKLVSVRIPEFIDKQIEALVDLGMFASRSDFINYAIQKTLFELSTVKLPISDDTLVEMMTLGPDSSDEEINEVIKNVEKEVRANFGGNRPERRRVLRVRRAGSSTSNRGSPDD